jgi:hypothetical protein
MPQASALARAMIVVGYRTVTNQRHNSVTIGADISRRFPYLLNESRDLRAICRLQVRVRERTIAGLKTYLPACIA